MGYRLNKPVTLSWLTAQLDLEYGGDGGTLITNVSSIGEAVEGSLTFSKLDAIEPSIKSIVILPATLRSPSIISKNPRLDFIRSLSIINQDVGFEFNFGKSDIDPSVMIGSNVVIEEGVQIGAGTVIEHNVVIYSGTSIGKNCIIRSNASVGGYGFGYERSEDMMPIKFTHLGGVLIGNNVEIGSNTCIARGTLGDTIVEDDVKLDNLIQIAHNCKIGKKTMMASHAAIGGSAVIGENCWISTSANVKNGLRIGNSAFVGIGAVVVRNIKDDGKVFGNPARKLI